VPHLSRFSCRVPQLAFVSSTRVGLYTGAVSPIDLTGMHDLTPSAVKCVSFPYTLVKTY